MNERRIFAIVVAIGILGSGLAHAQLRVQDEVTPVFEPAEEATGLPAPRPAPPPLRPLHPPPSPETLDASSWPAHGALLFVNHDYLEGGSPLDLGDDGRVAWQYPDALSPLVFRGSNVFRIGFARPPSFSLPTGTHVVELTGGDLLLGDLVSLDDSNATLRTSYAGTLTIRRANIRLVQMLSPSTPATLLSTNPPPRQQDRVRFANDDSAAGRVLGLQTNVLSVSVSTAGKALDIPIDRIARIELDPESREQARRMPRDVRAMFPDGRTLAFSLLKMTHDTIEGESEAWGRAVLARDAVRLIELDTHGMNRRSLLLNPARGLPAPLASGLIRFRNAGQLHGRLTSIDTDGTVRWSHPDSDAELVFRPRGVAHVVLSLLGRDGAVSSEPRFRVRLANGDVLYGTPLALDRERLTLDSSTAGRVELRRDALRGLRKEPAATRWIPDSVEKAGWKRTGNLATWSGSGGILMACGAAGSIGCDTGLTSRSRIEFNLAWEQAPALMIGLHVRSQIPDPRENPNAGCWVELGSGVVQFYSPTRLFLSWARPPVARPELERTGSARVTLLTDLTGRTVTLLLDGVPVQTWPNTGDAAGPWTGFQLFWQGAPGGRAIWISDLTCSDGVNDAQPILLAAAPKQDTLLLSPAQRLTGEVTALSRGKLAFTSLGQSLDAPLDAIDEILFAAPPAPPAAEAARPVILFHDGSRLAASIERVDSRAVHAVSATTGRWPIPRDAVREIRFPAAGP